MFWEILILFSYFQFWKAWTESIFVRTGMHIVTLQIEGILYGGIL